MNTIQLKPTLRYALLRSLKHLIFLIFIMLGYVAISVYFNHSYSIISYFVYLAVLPILSGLYTILYWKMVKYEINNQQIIYSRGIFNRKHDYLELFRIKDFERDQPLLMRMLNIMNFTLITSDQSHPVLIFRGIPVSNIPIVIRELVQHARKNNRVFEID